MCLQCWQLQTRYYGFAYAQYAFMNANTCYVFAYHTQCALISANTKLCVCANTYYVSTRVSTLSSGGICISWKSREKLQNAQFWTDFFRSFSTMFAKIMRPFLRQIWRKSTQICPQKAYVCKCKHKCKHKNSEISLSGLNHLLQNLDFQI